MCHRRYLCLPSHRIAGYEPSYLVANDLPFTLIALSQSIAFLPWACKFLFSYASDRWSLFGWGHRRPYCFIGLIGSGACFLILSTFRPRGGLFPLYVFLMVMRNCFIATSDGATEGLSVDANIEELSGSLQAWSMGGRMLGMAVGSAVGGPITEHAGYWACLIFLGVAMLSFAPINFFIREERAVDAASGYQHVDHGAGKTGVHNALVVNTGSDAGGDDVRGREIVVSVPTPHDAAGADGGFKPPAFVPAGAAATSGDAPAAAAAPSDTAMGAATPAAGDSIAAEAAGGEGDAGRIEKPLTELQVLWLSLRDPTLLALILYTFVSNLGTYLASFPIVMYAEEKGLSIVDIGCVGAHPCVGVCGCG